MRNLIKILVSWFCKSDQNIIINNGVFHYYGKTSSNPAYTFNGLNVNSKTEIAKIDAIFNNVDFDKLFK